MRKLSFHNTMSREAEPFTPINEGEARLYTCGPTVYNYAHIGNFRAYVFEDLLRRVLKLNDYKVTQVMNLTDVDDKTIRDSQKAGMSLNDFTAIYKKAFFEDLEKLNVEPAEHYPAATDHIPQMIDMIQTLVDKGYAYLADDKCVYYSIDKFEHYGCLAKIDRDNQMSGTRVKTDEYEKESVSDFALWKAWDKADGDVKWDSPWGEGRPGWHIECSAMAKATLGDHFDMHTGGVDNMFPHHEDEIAQSEAANGCKYVNYWMHCAHLRINNAKMSKSLGNFYTLAQLTEKGWAGAEVRYMLLATHYRAGLNFVVETGAEKSESLSNARAAITRLQNFIERIKDKADGELSSELSELCAKAQDEFLDSLNDDLNISGALGKMFDFIREGNRILDSNETVNQEALLNTLKYFNRILDVMKFDLDNDVPAEILALAEERQQARADKNWGRSDEIRDQLKAQGWVIEDTPAGPKVKKG
ncbi:cysteine--tRNA ligase [Lentisphaera araneosa]|jgi:cysteinyl-tRNA synthetase|nr:cysteine--tRNA ligase [Lentisphaera araneosa]